MAVGRAIAAGVVAAAALAAAVALPQDPEDARGSTVAHRAVLDPWYDALTGSGTQAANVVVMGDSVSEGFGLRGDLERRWVGQLQDALRRHVGAPGCPTGAGGYAGAATLVPGWYAAKSLPAPATTGDVRRLGTVGPGGRGLVLGPGATVSWDVLATEVAIGYRTGPVGGELEITVDGQETLAGQRVSTQDDLARRVVWHSAEQDLRARRWTVRNVSPQETVTVTDLTPYRGDRGRCVHVVDASHSGISAETISQQPELVRDALSTEPDLLVLPLGFNDARAGRTPERMRSSVSRIITTAREMGYDGPVLVVSWHAPPPAFFRESWGHYRSALRSLSTQDGVAFVDVGAEMPPVAGAPDGVYLDALHPGPRGQDIIAAAMTRTLTPPGPVRPPRASGLPWDDRGTSPRPPVSSAP